MADARWRSRITGDYWKPVFFVLKAREFDCQLYARLARRDRHQQATSRDRTRRRAR